MVAFAVIMMLAVVLLCGILYILMREPPGGNKKPLKRGGFRPSIKDMPGQGDDDRSADHPSVPPYGDPGDSAQSLQACLTKGMALTFSVEDLPPENRASLLKLDDVGAEVKQKVLLHLGSLKNFDTLHKLQRMIGDPQAAMAELSRMITGDPMLTAKILRVANSPYYGMEQKLNSISHAIMIIGLANLKGIIYNEGILNVLNEKSFHRDPTMQALWQHANYTAICASYLGYLFRDLNQGTLFTLGILHDIGKFLMMKLPSLPQNDSATARIYSPDWTMREEEDIYGINHALVGRLALQHWGLSELMVETVSLHHVPAYLHRNELGLDHEALQYLLVLFLADQAACLIAGESNGAGIRDAPIDRLHPSYHGLIDQKKLQQLLLDRSLLGQLREAEAIARASM
ncbi:MAG: HDOD domain-containing protein [Deltaproteobacteria bacterium]|nr:HDOD domain-containing protein [Deltaproteobacteria bacterium]